MNNRKIIVRNSVASWYNIDKPNFQRTKTCLFGLTPSEHEHLKKYGWDSYTKLLEGEGDATYWFNVTLRVRFGLELAALYFSDLNALQFKLSYDVCVGILDRYVVEGKFYLTTDEAETLDETLNAVDSMQHQLTRKQMMLSMRAVYKHMDNNYLLPPSKGASQ